MSEKNVAMFIQDNGERVQVGWASPAVEGVRTWDFLPGREDVKLRDVSFEDDELSQKVAAEQEENAPEEVDEVAPAAEPIEEAPDETLAADPVDDGVELSSGGQITDISEDDDEEAEFQRELEAEQERFAEEEDESEDE